MDHLRLQKPQKEINKYSGPRISRTLSFDKCPRRPIGRRVTLCHWAKPAAFLDKCNYSQRSGSYVPSLSFRTSTLDTTMRMCFLNLRRKVSNLLLGLLCFNFPTTCSPNLEWMFDNIHYVQGLPSANLFRCECDNQSCLQSPGIGQIYFVIWTAKLHNQELYRSYSGSYLSAHLSCLPPKHLYVYTEKNGVCNVTILKIYETLVYLSG